MIFANLLRRAFLPLFAAGLTGLALPSPASPAGTPGALGRKVAPEFRSNPRQENPGQEKAGGQEKSDTQEKADTPSKIGIFDLAAIRSVALDPEILKRHVANGIVTEYVRFTSVPGVRVLAIISYPKNAKALPGILFAQRFHAVERASDAKAGFVGVSVAPPIGNDDARQMDSIGGPLYSAQASFRQIFSQNPSQSYLYHHVVALLRAVDYLETRPEIDLSRTSVMGQDWTGMVVSLLHALDNRPGAYFVWQGAGYYADEDGNSGDSPARISRKAYEMYSPAAYAQYGTRPIFMANPLNSEMSRLDSVIEMVSKLKCPKILSYAPNRQEAESDHHEFDGGGAWETYLLSRNGIAPSISEGTVAVSGSKLIYTCRAEGQTGASVLVSYGKPGDFTGRTWHRIPMTSNGNVLTGVIPIYSATVPMYVIGQIQTNGFGERGNTPFLVEPVKMGAKPTATYPHQIFEGTAPYALYVSTSGDKAVYGEPGPNGLKAATLPVYWDGMIRLLNIEPIFWRGAKELHLWLKGDDAASIEPLTVYLAYESMNSIDQDQENYTAFPLVPAGEKFPSTWREFVIPLSKVGNLAQIDSLFFKTGLKPLHIAGVSWQ